MMARYANISDHGLIGDLQTAALVTTDGTVDSGQPAEVRIPLDWPDLPGRSWQLTDIVSQSMFERDGGELANPGLFVDLGPRQFHLLALR